MMSSDFSIAQFRFLETLLLVHGRWSYARITRMVLFFFYKNLLFGLTIFYFNCLCFFSGQTLYNGKPHLPLERTDTMDRRCPTLIHLKVCICHS